MGFPVWTHGATRFAPGLVEWSLSVAAQSARAEDRIAGLTASERDDEAFFDACKVAYGEDVAQRAMYERLKQRGMGRVKSS